MGKRLQTDGICSKAVHFSMQQAGFPIIRKLTVKNTGEETLGELRISIRAVPEFASPWEGRIPQLSAGETADLGNVPLELSSEFFHGLKQEAAGTLHLSVSNLNGEILESAQRELTLVAFDHWSGLTVMPESIASFVTPSAVCVGEVLNAAARLLQERSGSPVFTGYQSRNAALVKMQMEAVYDALREASIHLRAALVNFEGVGLRIGTSAAVTETKQGTALDLALLYCSCLEKAGLRPLMILEKDSAYAGCWLEEKAFQECVQEDVSLLFDCAEEESEEILLVDTAGAAEELRLDFADARRRAEQRAADSAAFRLSVDIRRARGIGIRPLFPEGSGTAEDSSPQPETLSAETEPLSRQQMWERRLLDLSLRNMLINFRATRRTLQLLVQDFSALEDALSAGIEFQIAGCPEEWAGSAAVGKNCKAESCAPEASEMAGREFAARRLFSCVREEDVVPAMTALARQARISLEENGSNTLYLALGFLKWYETDVSEKARYAPLVLLPIDIVRKSSRRGYAIRLREEEPQINITLLEMLRQDFGISIKGLDPLPRDEQGIDLKAVFETIRRETEDFHRWDVEMLAFIGLFSFSQFIMWSDIRNRAEDLKRNKIVRSLMSGKMEWVPAADFPDAETLDEEYLPDDIAVPIAADASQLSAICAAGKGKSFILHGPPGTGKSQTITNIIANALYQGKSVLFIAEKMAALSVVQKRLEKIGLAPFSLELHSNKAKKRDVLAQLRQALEIGRIRPVEDYEQQAARLHLMRTKLNEYVKALHRKQPFGFSVYEAVSRYEAYKSAPADICFLPEEIAALTPERLTVWEDRIGELHAAAEACGGPCGHPLREFSNSAYSPALKSTMGSRLIAYGRELAVFSEEVRAFSERLSLPAEDGERRYLSAVADLAAFLRDCKAIPETLTVFPALSERKAELFALCEAGRIRDREREELLRDFSEELLILDEAAVRSAWEEASQSWFLPRFSGQRKIIKSFRLLARQPRMVDRQSVEKILDRIALFQKSSQAVRAQQAFGEVFGSLWNGGAADWDKLESAFAAACGVQQRVSALTGSGEAARTILKNLAGICANPGGFRAETDAVLDRLPAHWAAVCRLEEELSELSGASFQGGAACLAEMSERQERWSGHLEQLRDWCNWIVVRERAAADGLGAAAGACQSGAVSASELEDAYFRGLYSACADWGMENEPALSDFHGAMFDNKIQRFRRACKEFEQLTRTELVAKLSARIPSPSAGAAASSEIGILQKAIRSGGRMLSIRRLFDSIPNLLRMLCPCMLMSPISVAQYIDPQYPPFDLVVFDEASQLPTCEAVGAIARGESVIVVGDPKQLPPTSFFASHQTETDQFETEDLESVLDDCLAISMPEEHLLWHYRSRHESLIAFSNMQYYENKLHTFPSPNDQETKVSLIHLDGCYDRGRSKQNRTEAEAVVAEILRRFADEKLRKDSIGVVTFSAVQQNLIEDLLWEAFDRNPQLEEWNNAAEEPVFVKNLENVQGDERDVILFSIGYGPDENGKVALNFGPLNREGGWRRLNVAVSRARKEMQVFSTLSPEQIDLSRTHSEGVAGLRAFLEFARRGKESLPVPVQSLTVRAEGFAEQVARRIRMMGYEVHTNIGCSAFKVDMAVVDPKQPEVYLLGILCDGPGYRDAHTARDRNLNQENVLRLLGWRLYRLWSVEWWEDETAQLLKIREAIEAAASQDRGIPLETPPEEKKRFHFDRHHLEREKLEEEAFPVYTVCSLEQRVVTAEDFCLPQFDELISEQLSAVLKAEAPVCREILFRRVLNAWGITRMGARLERRLTDLLDRMEIRKTVSGARDFFWSAETDPQSWEHFRVPEEGGFRRELDEIPPEELASAVHALLCRQISLPREDLIREIYRLFGFARTGASIEEAAEAGIRKAEERGYAASEDGRVVLRKPMQEK